MSRGRLIFPFLACIGQLDTVATEADPDGAGPLTSGYDPDFREPVRVPLVGSQVGSAARRELDPIYVPIQIEDEAWEALSAMRTGDSPRTLLRVVMHFADLERLGYVDSTTGDAKVPRKADRLISIHNYSTRALVQMMPGGGLFCTEAQPRSHGLGSLRRNLLLVVFENRDISRVNP